jgi:hypothetical protein
MFSSYFVISFFSTFIHIIIFSFVLVITPKYIHFKRSTYQEVTGHRFFNTILDKGR